MFCRPLVMRPISAFDAAVQSGQRCLLLGGERVEVVSGQGVARSSRQDGQGFLTSVFGHGARRTMVLLACWLAVAMLLIAAPSARASGTPSAAATTATATPGDTGSSGGQ